MPTKLSSVKPQRLSFPKSFKWGFAAAAPQIEGAAFEDGKGPSIWDAFARRPGCVAGGDHLDVACDHYRRYREDFRLMRELGARHYRLSIAWPRIVPDGDGTVNQRGLDFYKRLLDALGEEGITPWVTLFHWDLPNALEERYGGWRDRKVVNAFARYADTVVKELSGRVKNWITLNEIFCFTHLAYSAGTKAPGLRLAQAVVNQTFHHAVLCHGEAVRSVREHGGRGARVGLTDNSIVSIPVTETEPDIQAARTQFLRDNWRVLEPIYRGAYHPDYLKEAGKDRPKVERGDLERISLPTDFLGMNLYTGHFVRSDPKGQPEIVPYPGGFPKASPNWLFLAPQAIYWGCRHAAERYGPKAIYITENGCGFVEQDPQKGRVDDLHRREYLRSCLSEVRRAIVDGVPVKGYFLWSFMDNFEWEDGYLMRFGVVHCDFKTQKRTPKLSARWYAEVMRTNSLV